jgi:hypothetical protein
VSSGAMTRKAQPLLQNSLSKLDLSYVYYCANSNSTENPYLVTVAGMHRFRPHISL